MPSSFTLFLASLACVFAIHSVHSVSFRNPINPPPFSKKSSSSSALPSTDDDARLHGSWPGLSDPTKPRINATSTSTEKVFHPSIMHHILDPSNPSKSGLDGKSAFSFMSTIRGASDAIPTEWKMYYFANIHLGLDLNVPESSLDAFRRCMYLNQSVLNHLARLHHQSPVTSLSPSLCGIKLIALTESHSSTFPAGTWSPIPDAIRISLAYYCSGFLDPDFMAVMGRTWDFLSPSLQQAFYFHVVRQLTYYSYTQRLLPSLMNGVFKDIYSKFEFVRQSQLKPRRELVLLAAASNEDRILTHHEHLVSRSAILDKILEAVPQMAEARRRHILIRQSFQDLLMHIIDQDRSKPSYNMLFSRFVKSLRKLLDLGLDINILCADKNPHSPVRLAIRLGRLEVLNELVMNGLNIHGEQGFYDFLCDAMGSQDQMTMMEYLLEIGASARRKYTSGNSILHVAALDHDMEVNVIQLLVNYSAEGNVRNTLGWHPVHQAAHGSNLLVVDYMIHRPDIFGHDLSTIRTATGEDLFLVTCRSPRPNDLLSYLLGGFVGPVKIDQVDIGGRSCIDRLYQKGGYFPHESQMWIDELQSMQNHSVTADRSSVLPSSEMGSFVRACRHAGGGNVQVLSLMLHRGADINDQDDGISCLTFAINQRDLKLASYALDHGATIPVVHHEKPHCWFTRRGKHCAMESTKLFHRHPVVVASRAGVPFVELVIQAAEKTGVDLWSDKRLIKTAKEEARSHHRPEVVALLDSYASNSASSSRSPWLARFRNLKSSR